MSTANVSQLESEMKGTESPEELLASVYRNTASVRVYAPRNWPKKHHMDINVFIQVVIMNSLFGEHLCCSASSSSSGQDVSGGLSQTDEDHDVAETLDGGNKRMK